MSMNAWQQLEPRQRGLIALAGVVLVAVLVYVWLWEPLAEARESARARIAGQQALLSWLEDVTPMAERLRRNSASAPDSGERSLLGLADETARASGLAGTLARIEPVGDAQVRVWLEGAEFVGVMQWLETFSRSPSVRVDQLQVDGSGSEGRVNVRVTLVSNA